MIKYIKRNRVFLSRFGACLLLCAILLIAFLIRVQPVSLIPDGQFTGSDPYFYYRNAQIISEHGKLPTRDMTRWLPVGRDLEQILPLYSYALAYTHKVVARVYPKLTLYQLTLYAPTVCFVLGLSSLLIFLWRNFGILFASLVGILLATLPTAIDRSVVGFSDRDAWCLMLGIVAVITYLTALQTAHKRNRLLWTLVSGATMFMGGMSWEGFGVFGIVIVVVELWRMLTTENEEGLGLYLLWVCTFVPPLYLIFPAYHNGQWFATHLRDFMLFPALGLLIIRACRYLLLTKSPFADKLRPYAQKVNLILLGIISLGALIYIFNLISTFDDTTVSFSQTRLMQTVKELDNPDYTYWVSRYGYIFILASLSIVVTSLRLWKEQGLLFAVFVVVFCLIAFLGTPLDKAWGESPVNKLLLGAVGGAAFGLIRITVKRKEQPENELTYIAFFIWFIFWVALTRNAIRYDFFTGIPLAFFTTELILFLSNFISENLRNSKYTTDEFRKHIKHTPLRICISVLMLSALLFWSPAGAFARSALFIGKHIRSPYPGKTQTNKALVWMKTHVPSNAVVAANWEHGNLLSAIAGVKTITDADHFLPHWITLYYRHVHCDHTTQEALEFLKTHNATHLMLTEIDLLRSGTYAFVGEYTNKEVRSFTPRVFQVATKRLGEPQRLTGLTRTPFASITFDNASPASLTARIRTGKLVKLPYVTFNETQQKRIVPQNADLSYGGTILYLDKYQHIKKSYHLPPDCWNSLAARLYYKGELTDVFVPVYPTSEDAAAKVRVWEIHYPSDIKSNPKYLATEPEK